MTSVWQRGFKSSIPEPEEPKLWFCSDCNLEFEQGEPCECEREGEAEAVALAAMESRNRIHPMVAAPRGPQS